MCICFSFQLVRQRQRIDIFVLWISEKHLRKMMSLVFIVFLPARFSSILSISVLIAFILALVLERKMKWRSKKLGWAQHNDDAFNILVRELNKQKLEINLSKVYTIETGVRCSNSIQFRTNFSSHGFVSIKFNRFYCLFEIEKSNTIKSKAFLNKHLPHLKYFFSQHIQFLLRK